MPDAAPTLQPAVTDGQPSNGTLTPERIERVLADFRDWLSQSHAQEVTQPPVRQPVDLHTVVSQFIALRHEVNLQTRAARASLEQNAETLRRLDDAIEDFRNPPEEIVEDDTAKPLLKALVDVYDALALSLQQVERQKTAIQQGLDNVLQAATSEKSPLVSAATARPGLWRRLFGVNADSTGTHVERDWNTNKEREDKVRSAVVFLKEALDGLITGYTMSLNRIDRVLPQFGLERIACAGERFDPELMEVVEVVTEGQRSPGEVIEDVRRGYRLNGTVFRYAQVRVAK